MQINIKKVHKDAQTPTYGTVGAACFDIYSTDGGFVSNGEGSTFGTGLSFEIPEGHVMLVYSRSGHAFKFDVRLANCVGVIDSDYRGELMVKLSCDSNEYPYIVTPGERIAQAMIIPVAQVTFNNVDELNNTDRGTGGLGSTGQ